jgi:ABC transporter substrate binding protein
VHQHLSASNLDTGRPRWDHAARGGAADRPPQEPPEHVGRILSGAKPADLPIEQPMTFDLVVNLKAAQALEITFPNEIMLQVTEVIE